MICPACGHSFTPVPKLSHELRVTLRDICERLDTVEGELGRGELWRRIFSDSNFHWSAAMIHLKANGVLHHPAEDGGKAVKFRWLVNKKALRKLSQELWK